VGRLPEAGDAIAAVREALGWDDATARRFSNGLAFYVFDVVSDAGRAVVRLGLPEQRAALKESLGLAGRLRPLGVLLPALLHDGTDADLPYVILERFGGTDLGDVFGGLDVAQRRGIARQVAEAQLAAARLGTGTRFGYAGSADTAPHPDWAAVVRGSVERSRQRIAANGFFSVSHPERLLDRIERFAPRLREIAATPFLHDTTTKNVIVTGEGRFSGIVDVDDLCFGDPRYAAALTAVALATRGHDLDYVETWLAAIDLENDDLFQLYIAVFLLDFMAEHGMVFNGNMTPSRAEDRAQLLGLFKAAMDRIE